MVSIACSICHSFGTTASIYTKLIILVSSDVRYITESGLISRSCRGWCNNLAEDNYDICDKSDGEVR